MKETQCAYFHTRDEYTVQDGLVFKGDRVVIPYHLRAEMREAIHTSHIGIEGCLRRAWDEFRDQIAHIHMCSVQFISSSTAERDADVT